MRAVEDHHYPVVDPFVGRFPRPPAGGFRWTLPTEYRPQDRDDFETWGPWLIARDSASDAVPQNREWFDVLADPRRAGFHRRFARLADERDDIRLRRMLKFANLYGWLHERRAASPERMWLRRNDGWTGDIQPLGESRYGWDQAVFTLAALVELWDLLRRGDRVQVSRLVHWHGDIATISCSWIDGRLVPGNSVHRESATGWLITGIHDDKWLLPGIWNPDDPMEPAWEFLLDSINKGLVGHVSPQLGLSPDLDLRYRPHSLLAAIYLHFAQEISGRRRGVVPCARLECNANFEPRRHGQRFCSAECRKLDWWHRH